ncbi:mitochondrial import inner membrane translocase subunit Tim9 isoform X1 [Bos indicus]|uniref:Mitochondrial import inner membrane translocase subunit n=1 Tax=Bos indicus TaxID=9915 RepID=A0ABM4T147_BOSIN|nr:mitochondrial import inner membrane translocase subunit Tim9 isoform X2 [Bos indicus x Bos taurus]
MRESVLKYGLFSLSTESRVSRRGGGRQRSGKGKKSGLTGDIQVKIGQLLFQNRKETHASRKFKEFLGTYNKLTETCFLDCVKDFTTREVKPEETTCSEHCLQKYLKMTQRISMRFQEYHIQQNEALAAKAGLLGQPR